MDIPSSPTFLSSPSMTIILPQYTHGLRLSIATKSVRPKIDFVHSPGLLIHFSFRQPTNIGHSQHSHDSTSTYFVRFTWNETPREISNISTKLSAPIYCLYCSSLSGSVRSCLFMDTCTRVTIISRASHTSHSTYCRKFRPFSVTPSNTGT